MTTHKTLAAVLGAGALATAAATALAAPGDPRPHRGLPQGGESVTLDPADFTLAIDNPYWPMRPGDRWVFSETDTTGAREKVVVEVTDRTKRIANGVLARVVRDTATEGGEPVETTDDWYAQDRKGNIWYLGEDVRNFEDGRLVDRDGSFEAGVGGAQAGIAMPADPVAGLAYRQEYAEGDAEDTGAVVTVGQERVQVPFGAFRKDVLMTRDLDALAPRVQELKFYVKGVGPVLSVHTDGAGGRAVLVKKTRRRP